MLTWAMGQFLMLLLQATKTSTQREPQGFKKDARQGNGDTKGIYAVHYVLGVCEIKLMQQCHYMSIVTTGSNM